MGILVLRVRSQRPINGSDPTGFASGACATFAGIGAASGVAAGALGVYTAYSAPADLVPGVNAANISGIALAGAVIGVVAAVGGVESLLYC